MNEQQKERLIKHLNFLREELNDYDLFKGVTWEVYSKDKSKRREMERWIENLVNSSIDISKLILTAEEVRLPETYKDVVSNGALRVGSSEEEAKNLARWVALRNIVAHEYLDIRWDSIRKFIKEAGSLYQNFLKRVTEYLKKRLKTK